MKYSFIIEKIFYFNKKIPEISEFKMQLLKNSQQTQTFV
jgi:hypothetical protein